MNNKFEQFTFDYFDFIKNNCNGKFITKSCIHPFDSFIYKKIYDDKLHKLYNDVISYIYEEDITSWIDNLQDFCVFIRTAEKCFMYKNSEDSNIYVEFLKDEELKNIFFVTEDYKCKVSFEQTKIPNISGIYIDDSDDNETLTFINFEIVREFGKQMKNKFRFITGEHPKFNDKSDEVLFLSQKQQLSNMMKCIYNEILDNIIGSYIMDLNNIISYDWREVITNGIWVRR